MTYKWDYCPVVALLWLLAAALPLMGESELHLPNDPAAAPVRAAGKAFLAQLLAGNSKNAKAIFAGKGADVALLDAYLDGIAASKELAAAINAKFGRDPERHLFGLDRGVTNWSEFIDSGTIIVDGDEAFSSAGGPIGMGFGLKNVNGTWNVASLASRPNSPADHLARLKVFNAAVQDLINNVKKGSYKTSDDVAADLEEAHNKLARIGLPAEAAPATEPTNIKTSATRPTK